ncbi:hypothetical protein AB0I68_35850 [Streptomyces sp. NPDC050448]|uniref:hypothetical protein n=1 Tax=Streptomyces sp. NPDC050448 TaxID=3155404 RepID=UPI00344A0D58
MGIDSVERGEGLGQSRGPLLVEVVRDVLREFAPQELPLLAGLEQFDDAEIGRRFATGTKGDDPLGFGVGEVVVLVTPIIWGAVQKVTDRLAESASDGLQTRVRALFRRRRVGTEPAPLPHFGPAELLEVQSRVVEMASKAGMERARAEQLAASVVGRIQLGSVGTDAT